MVDCDLKVKKNHNFKNVETQFLGYFSFNKGFLGLKSQCGCEAYCLQQIWAPESWEGETRKTSECTKLGN